MYVEVEWRHIVCLSLVISITVLIDALVFGIYHAQSSLKPGK